MSMALINLKKEMAGADITIEALAAELRVHRNTIANKIDGNSKFTIDEAFKIQNKFYVVVRNIPASLDDEKANKLIELKAARDSRETSPIEYNGHLFDFDEKSYSRITAARYALDVSGGTIHWTTADNDTVEVSADDLRGVIAFAAVRSNALHIKYRGYKERVNAALNASEVRAVVWTD